jgi:hypothetical protein
MVMARSPRNRRRHGPAREGAILSHPAASVRRAIVSAPVIVFVILGHVPTVLLLAQVGMLYLAWLDLRDEDDLDFQVKVWWFLLVLIFNVLGLLAEKLWIFERRRRRRTAAQDR